MKKDDFGCPYDDLDEVSRLLCKGGEWLTLCNRIADDPRFDDILIYTRNQFKADILAAMHRII